MSLQASDPTTSPCSQETLVAFTLLRLYLPPRRLSCVIYRLFKISFLRRIIKRQAGRQAEVIVRRSSFVVTCGRKKKENPQNATQNHHHHSNPTILPISHNSHFQILYDHDDQLHSSPLIIIITRKKPHPKTQRPLHLRRRKSPNPHRASNSTTRPSRKMENLQK